MLERVNLAPRRANEVDWIGGGGGARGGEGVLRCYGNAVVFPYCKVSPNM